MEGAPGAGRDLRGWGQASRNRLPGGGLGADRAQFRAAQRAPPGLVCAGAAGRSPGDPRIPTPTLVHIAYRLHFDLAQPVHHLASTIWFLLTW